MRRVLVVGPAYADMVLRVDQSLLNRGVIDGSVEGILGEVSERWRLQSQAGDSLEIVEPSGTLPQGVLRHRIMLPERLSTEGGRLRSEVFCLSCQLDLGGMGAGYAKSFGGVLVSAFGVPDGTPDPFAVFVTQALVAQGITALPIWMEGTASDWTLLITSGPHGDKLAIGFRGCHSSVTTISPLRFTDVFELVVVAGFSNRVAGEALLIPARTRLLAPARRNMNDRDLPLASLAGRFDVLSCNRGEWLELQDRDRVTAATPIVAVTNGKDGCWLSFLAESGKRTELTLPAFRRDHPPADTNRAGESFATTLVETVLDRGWSSGPISESLIRSACERAMAAAALTLDRLDFGFPTQEQIDQVMRDSRL